MRRIKLKTGKYRIIRILLDNISLNQFNNWAKLSDEDIELEYMVEYQYHIRYKFGNIFPTLEDFKTAIKNARVEIIDKDFDELIGNRSHCNNIECIFELIKSYASYPQYRNEDTVMAIDNGFKNNLPMKFPIILEINTNRGLRYWCMAGNSRLDLAFINGIKPKALIINIDA